MSTPSQSGEGSRDPILTTLCSICHIQPPKYRCPRCSLRTCSLPCTRRHKAWSNCSGIRDATAYVPRSKLKTPAGIDHDFNFLSGIERAAQRAEREIVEERGLVGEEELRPIEVRSVQWRRRKDGTKRKVMVTELLRRGAGGASRAGGGGGGNGGDGRPEMSKQMKRRLATFGIHIKRVPMGMTRQKENATNIQRASGRINWQVEWLLLDGSGTASQSQKDKTDYDTDEDNDREENEDEDEDGSKVKSIRIMTKVLDTINLHTAFGNGHATYLHSLRPKDTHQEEHAASSSLENTSKSKKGQKQGPPSAENQDPSTTTWPLGDHPFQHPQFSTWKRHAGPAPFTGLSADQLAQRAAYVFYLSPNPHSRTRDNKILLQPLDAESPLCEALRNTTILEFPTIYVFPSGTAIPSSFQLSREPSRPQKRRRESAGVSNSSNRGLKNGTAPRSKHRKPNRDLEDGEVCSEEDDDAGTVDGDNSGYAGQGQGQGAFVHGRDDGHRGEVVAEESLGEDDDVDDDTTSSSGSDSDLEDDQSVGVSLAGKVASMERA